MIHNKMKRFLACFLFLIFISMNSYAVPVGGITKFFKGIFSKGDEVLDAGSTIGKSSDEMINASSEFNKLINPETYKGQPFEDVIEEISAMNAEPIEGLKNYFNPAENSAAVMSDGDYSLWMEYFAIKGAAKSLQKQSEENTNKVKLCKYFEVSYHFLEVSSGELILLGVNNREIKKVLPLIYENEEYKQYHFQNKNNSIQFIFYDDGRFILSEKRKVYVQSRPAGVIQRCEYLS